MLPSNCLDDAALLALGLIVLGALLGCLLLVAGAQRGRTIVRDAEGEAQQIRERAELDALALNREVIELWRTADRVLKR